MEDAINIGESLRTTKYKGFKNKHNDISFKYISEINAHKNQKSIESLVSRVIINGKGEDISAPHLGMTRAEFITIVVKALGLLLKNNQMFEDVSKDNWFYFYVSTSNHYGVANGVTEKISTLIEIY